MKPFSLIAVVALAFAPAQAQQTNRSQIPVPPVVVPGGDPTPPLNLSDPDAATGPFGRQVGGFRLALDVGEGARRGAPAAPGAQPATGVAPLNPANNLSDVGSASAAAINLGVRHGIDPRAAPYNARCDARTDDTAAFNSASADARAAGAPLIMPEAVCYVGKTANVALGAVEGSAKYGYSPNPTTEPGTLLLDPSHTISPAAGAKIANVRVLRYGFTQPKTLRDAIRAVATFSGTAFTIRASDISLINVHIEGFNQLIAKQGDRINLINVEGDGTNGLLDTFCGDTCQNINVEFWPFTTAPYNMGANSHQLSSISSVTNRGGVCQASLEAAPQTPVVTGDTVFVSAPGMTGCTGRFIATAIDSKTFTLNGSTFGGAYAGSGKVFMTANLRTGKAWEQTGFSSNWIVNFIEFGWDTSMHFGGKSYGTRCTGCWMDGFANAAGYVDKVSSGIIVDGSAYDIEISDFDIFAKAHSIQNNSAAGGSALMLNNGVAGVLGGFAGITGSGFASSAGNALISNTVFRTNCGAGTVPVPWASVTGGATLKLSNVNLGSCLNTSIEFDSPKACANTFVDGVAGPCSFMPTVYGATSGVENSPNYTRQDGQYTVSTAGVVTLWENIVLDNWNGASGFVRGALPAPSGSGPAPASCSIARLAGFTATTNYNALVAQVSPNQGAIIFGQTSIVAGHNTIAASVSNFSTPAEIAVTCTYHR